MALLRVALATNGAAMFMWSFVLFFKHYALWAKGEGRKAAVPRRAEVEARAPRFGEELSGNDAELAGLIERDILDSSPSVHWDDIAGLEEAKRVLEEARRHRDMRRHMRRHMRRIVICTEAPRASRRPPAASPAVAVVAVVAAAADRAAVAVPVAVLIPVSA